MNRIIVLALAFSLPLSVAAVNAQGAQGGPLAVIDGKIDVLDGKMDALDGKIDVLDGKMDDVDAKVDDLSGKLDDVEGLLNTRPELRFVKLPNFVLAGTNAVFQIRLLCDASFSVKSFIVTARDATQSVNIDFYHAMILSNPFGPDLSPPSGWNVGHTDFPIDAGASSQGHELLSNMGVTQLGLPVDASFDIFGSRTPNTGLTTLTIGATIETEADIDNTCQIVVVDF
jgi:hypothetical protein